MVSSRSRWILLALRVALGLTFAYAAWTKLREPWAVFAMEVDAYGILPQWGVIAVARVLPWAELVLGLVLIAGVFLRLSSLVCTGILAFFFTLVTRAYLMGMEINCGCFASGEPISPRTLLRDGVLLAASIAMTVLAFLRRRAKPAPAPVAEVSAG